MGAGSIGAILAGPPSGRVADRRGRRIVFFAAAAAQLGGLLALEPPLAAVSAVAGLALILRVGGRPAPLAPAAGVERA